MKINKEVNMEALTQAWISLNFDEFKEVFYNDFAEWQRGYVSENFHRFQKNPCAQYAHLDFNNKKEFCVNLNLWWEQNKASLV